MQTQPRLAIREVSWSNPVGADLRAARHAEHAVHFTGAASAMPPDDEQQGIFLVAYELASGQPLGCGGVRRAGAGVPEIDDVYVVPFARGSGVANAILDALRSRVLRPGSA